MSDNSEKEMLSNLGKAEVHLDGTWRSLIVWFVGRFGVLAIVSVVFAMATKQIYEDMREDRLSDRQDRQMLIDAYQENTRAMRSFEDLLQRTLDEVEELR